MALTGEYTKGDTLTGTSVLRNAVPQFGKPKGARVVPLASFASLPGGTLRARGAMGEVAGNSTVAIVGGTGLYAGASGLIEGHVLVSGVQLDVVRLQVP